jgi:drug/metabolite transporter (DMT)-like permease
MSTAARFDIRIPIGALFSLLGVVLTAYGILTRSDAQLYARSENIIINLWWGLIMAVFGALMIFFGTRAKQRPLHSAAGEETEIREHRTGLERE